jgi:hypothetical protein
MLPQSRLHARAIRVSEPVLEDEAPTDKQDQGKDNAQ